MFLSELREPQLLVIYPGRFMPWHRGHNMIYQYLTGKFGRNNVYIATSNKVEEPKSPFSFSEKSYFMQLTGVPADRIVQATQPYQITNVLQSGHIQIADPANTVAIFAVSEKDMAEDPRFSFAPKKDGSAPYFQKLVDIKQTESMDKHGYIMTVPTFDFKVLDQPMRSGTELRKMYAEADVAQRQAIIKDLFGRYTREAEQIMSKLVPASTVEPVALKKKTELQKVKTPKAEPVAETVDVNAIHAEALREHLLSNPALYENREDFLSMREFLNTHKTPIPTIGKSYVYASVQATPVVHYINQAHFSNKHKLVKLDGKYAYFDINGVVKSFPETANQAGDVMSQIYFFNSHKELSHFNSLLKLKFAEYTCATKALDEQGITEDLAWIRSRLGEGAVDALTARHIEYIGQDIAKLKERIATEKLPAQYIEKLKQKIAQLEQERSQLAFNPNEGA